MIVCKQVSESGRFNLLQYERYFGGRRRQNRPCGATVPLGAAHNQTWTIRDMAFRAVAPYRRAGVPPTRWAR